MLEVQVHSVRALAKEKDSKLLDACLELSLIDSNSNRSSETVIREAGLEVQLQDAFLRVEVSEDDIREASLKLYLLDSDQTWVSGSSADTLAEDSGQGAPREAGANEESGVRLPRFRHVRGGECLQGLVCKDGSAG
eukprot:scaffold4101_cov267-Pinguiococcus_pyrenoidosus.AAC.10